MITFNRLRLSARRARHQWQARRLMARANRLLVRANRPANPGYDELNDPVFLTVMALAIVVLVVDVSDSWQRVDSLIAALTSVMPNIKPGA